MYIYLTEAKKQDGCNIYVIMKPMCPPGYHNSGFVTIDIYTYIYTYIYTI